MSLYDPLTYDNLMAGLVVYFERQPRALLESVEDKEVVDGDLSNYFGEIPHAELMKSIARRVSDGRMLRLIKAWRAGEGPGTNRARRERKGTPQGAPIYALFYTGSLDVYRPISGTSEPIYVGKAVPPGSRKGAAVNENAPALRRRIGEHAKSIVEARNLNRDASLTKERAIGGILPPFWPKITRKLLILGRRS